MLWDCQVDDALDLYDALSELPESAVVSCLPGADLDVGRIATQFVREAHHRLRWRKGADYLIAPWFLNGGEAARGVAMWSSTPATQKVVNGGTIT